MAAEEGSYKHLQESFVSNLNGTTALEISLVTSFCPLSIVLRSLLSYITLTKYNSQKILEVSVIFVLEYAALILPILLSFTVLANHAFTVFVLLVSVSALPMTVGSIPHLLSANLDALPFPWHKKRFLCNFRAYVNIATAISILAVDFVIYPRRFAKTETYGTGLMDVGVGSFIISNAVVSRDARGLSSASSSFILAVKQELRAVSLLLGIGLVRFLAVKGTDYHEHVSEYGVHWNFFLTLAFVRVFSTIFLRSLPHYFTRHSWLMGILLGLLYEYLLANGLEDFVLNGSDGDGSRINFIDANREGICSCVGYLSLYFIGIGIGKMIFRKKHSNLKSAVKLFFWLVSIVVLTWSVLFYWTHKAGRISRRLANFPFILWQISYNTQLLATFLLVDILLVSYGSQNMFVQYPGGCSLCSGMNDDAPVRDEIANIAPTNSNRTKHDWRSGADKLTSVSTLSGRPKCSCLITALNFNQLGYFLIANLLTGAVNLSFETINASPFTAFLVLNAYLLLLNCIIMVLYKQNILLKF